MAGLEQQLSGTRQHAEHLASQLLLQQDEAAQLRRALEGAQQHGATLAAKLRAAEEAGAALQDSLRAEQQARADERDAGLQQLEAARQKAASDLSVKDAIISAIKIEKAQLEARLSADKSQLAKDVAALQAREAELAGSVASLEHELRVAREEHAALQKKKEQLDVERFNLISVAVKCQEAQLKLRTIFGKLKEEDVIKMLYGDDSCATLNRNASRVGELHKQGGSDKKKWATRYVVLNDIFLLYYAGKSDKHCKGVIRMDQARAERVELPTRPFTFKITINVTGREFFFGAQSEDDAREWLSALDKALW